ncbi:MAG: hypothetical protein MR611_07855 [Coriobacteriaceae bacterium]|nr:hypothetical protein [Coriobacteriaceae bacterium]
MGGARRGSRGAYGRRSHKWKWADQIAEWERFRQDAFQFAVDNGYDHPAFTDWVWHGARDAGGDNKYD